MTGHRLDFIAAPSEVDPPAPGLLSSRLRALRDLDLSHVKRRRIYQARYMRAWRAKRKAERERLLAIAAAVKAYVTAEAT